MKRSQTARTSPGVSGPFQWRGVGKWRSRVAGSSRRSSVVHRTGRSATISTLSRRGSVVFIHSFYPPPPFPKTTPNTSEPAVIERLWKFLRKKALSRWHLTFEAMQGAVAEVLDRLGEYRDELSTLMTERFAIVEVGQTVVA